MFLKSSAKIVLNPENKTKKHEAQSSWKKTALLKIEDDIGEYYCWFLKKRYNLILLKPIREAHITFINDRIEDTDLLNYYSKAIEKYNNKTVEFEYNTDVQSNGMHWWLPVKSEELIGIRHEIGIGDPYFGLHLSIGRAEHLMKEHSEYILRGIRTGLIS